MVRRRTQFRLNKASARAHIVEGLLRAVDRIDEVIRLIREAANDDVAERGLIDRFGFSQLQAQAILDMRLRRLTGLQREKLEEEMRQLQADIASYERILGDPRTLLLIISPHCQKQNLTSLRLFLMQNSVLY